MNRHTLADRLRYAFDNFMSRGTIALIVGLFVASALMVLGIALVVVLLGGLEDEATTGIDFIALLWMSMLRTLDPGTMADDAGSLIFVLGMLSATIGGILLVAILIGVVTSGIEGRLGELRRGRSRVIEEGHTIVLGWSAQALTLINGLVAANANRRNQCIVVLAERDKVEMEDELGQRIPDRRTTRIVCRSGSPIDPADIEICSPQSARSIIVLSPEQGAGDADVIKTLLAISNSPTRRAEPYQLVAEIHDPRNVEVARLAARREARVVVVGETIGRITAQACRQPGLSVVYEELLSFSGDEIYFVPHLGLAGKAFGEALLEFADSALIGIAPATGRPELNPPMDRRIADDDRLIVLAADDDAVRRVPPPPGVPISERIVQPGRRAADAERTLVLGWNWRAVAMLQQLDRYVAAGSSATVASAFAAHQASAEEVGGGLGSMRLDFRHADTTSRSALEGLLAEDFDHVVILAYSDTLPEQQADSRTLVTLLHLRDIAAQASARYSTVTEVLDLRNRDLAQVTRADDFIVSEKLVSQMLAQLSDNPELEDVYAVLFDVAGSEIYLRPASEYVRLAGSPDDGPIDFYTLVEAARRRSEVAIGYRLLRHADDPARNYGVVVNPNKREQVALTPDDRIIVLAEE